MTYQQITIVGNVGRDPELKYTQSGTAVTDFSVAVNRSWTSNTGEKHEETTWFRITCWNRLAETVAEYVTKGMQVLVVGDRIQADTYMGNDGTPRASLTVTANTVRFLGSRGDNMAGGGSGGYSTGGGYGGGRGQVDAASGGFPDDNDFSPPGGADNEGDIPF